MAVFKGTCALYHESAASGKAAKKGLFAVYALYRYEGRKAASMGGCRKMTSDGEE
jgi:hypothetical protein